MMRVLDIDLDFFLRDVCPFAEEGERPDVRGHEPWTEEETVRFLKEHLKLDASRPIPGRVFETHDGALDFWRDLISSGELCAPFSITHVDAHTDLGIAQKGHPYVRHSVLGRPPEKRCDLDFYRQQKQLNEANYLLFALSFRWAGEIVNVRNPKSLPDMPGDIIMPEKNALHLRSAFPQLFEAKYGEEPFVPYRECADPKTYFASLPFECMSLAVSPRYAPKEADRLIDCIMAFARPV